MEDVALASLAATLARAQSGEVRVDRAGRHLYAGDASHHRVLPLGVVTPRTEADVLAVLATCRDQQVPVVPRGAGTSLAGNAIGPGLVVDTSRHLRALAIDPGSQRATVQPGVVLDDLRVAANGHGLTFGPDPSTSNRCTLGGMLGNNACGAHSLTTGRTSDNVHRIRLARLDGTVLDTAGATDLDGPLQDLGERVADEVARRHPPIPRRVSGYNLDDLAPGRFDLASFLVGTEGTLGIVVEAEVGLVDWSPHRAVCVLGYPTAADAADHVPALLSHLPGGGVRVGGIPGRRVGDGPIALEGIDAAVVTGARHRGAAGTALLPEGEAWLLVEFDGASPSEALAGADRCAEAATVDGVPAVVVDDPVAQAALWQVRTAGLGAVTFVPGEPAKVGGWEDAAVDPARLGSYLRGFGELADQHGYAMATYGHFGDGCVHTKIGVDHSSPEGIADFRRFVEAAADLAIDHGGSLSGEHGDGRSRSELLERMLGPVLVAAHREAKALFDPDGLLNPGVVVDPDPLDGALRLSGLRPELSLSPTPGPGGFDLEVAAHRCIGMGVCRRDDDHGTMCPTYRVTGDEQHSTRGRARLLQEALRPDADPFSPDDPGVAASLDLCLSCKGCVSDCPVDVDLPAMKAQFNSQRWRGRRRGGEGRPRLQTAFGLTPWLLRAGSRAPRLANAVAGSRVGRRSSARAGVAPERPVPLLATSTFRDWWRDHGGLEVPARVDPVSALPGGLDGTEVLLFVDTFSDTLAPRGLVDTARVLEGAGHRVVVLSEAVCCARPLVDPGMLGLARRTLGRTVAALTPWARAGVPIVGIEASCTSTLVDEARWLVGGRVADDVADAVSTLAGVLAADVEAGRWTPPRLAREAVVHGHCHQHATVRLDAEARLFDAMGLRWRDLDAGCCGLAGAFGFEAGEKYDTSVAIAQSRLLPAVRDLDPDVLLIADGWSCRTQLDHLGAGRRPWHLATLLAAATDADATGAGPSSIPADEPA